MDYNLSELSPQMDVCAAQTMDMVPSLSLKRLLDLCTKPITINCDNSNTPRANGGGAKRGKTAGRSRASSKDGGSASEELSG